MSESASLQSATAAPSSGNPPGALLPAGSTTPAVSTASGSPVPKRNRVHRRCKPPKDSRVYKAALSTIALKAQGLKYSEISEQLGLTVETLKTYLKRANAKGWINKHSFDDPEDKLEYALKHKVVDNLSTILNETNGDDISANPSNRALEVSLEVAKGTGLLKQHQVVKTDSQSTVGFALKVQVEMPSAAGTSPSIRAGHIGGTPAINAEVIDSSGE